MASHKVPTLVSDWQLASRKMPMCVDIELIKSSSEQRSALSRQTCRRGRKTMSGK